MRAGPVCGRLLALTHGSVVGAQQRSPSYLPQTLKQWVPWWRFVGELHTCVESASPYTFAHVSSGVC